MGRQISSICRGLLRQITGSDVNGQRSTKDKCKNKKVKIRLNFNTYTNTMQYFCIIYSFTIILQRSKYLQSCLGLGILLCSKWLWLFFFKNLLFWWQALDGVLVEPPEMGLLGNSGKKVTNDCIALIHLHIQPIYLSNIFVLLRGIFTSIRYICREMLYRF